MTSCFIVVSQWNNDISWVKEYTNNYVIYDKSDTLEPGANIIKCKNVGHNLFDIFHFIYTNYDNLPKLIAFVEGNPFDHCNKEKFDRIINNKFFTCLESYEKCQDYHAVIKCSDGGWMEINNSWYISDHPRKEYSKFSTYNEALDYVFKDAYHPQFVKFSPGGMYIVERERLLYYSKSFWEQLMKLVSSHANQPEAYIFERMLWTIFSCCFESNI